MVNTGLQFFGGRGSSSAGGGGGSGGATGELILPDGTRVEFDGTLSYGENDAALSDAVRKQIEGFEKKRVKGKIEYAYAVDANGNPIGKEKRGGKNSVSVPLMYHDTDGSTFTHIHPRSSDGILGGTFSDADLYNFANFKGKTTRAAAKEGTYSISKTPNFDASGFKGMVAKANREFDSNVKAANKSLLAQVRGGTMSYKDYNLAFAKVFNTELVALHNKYSNGQSTYGYTYTLERP